MTKKAASAWPSGISKEKSCEKCGGPTRTLSGRNPRGVKPPWPTIGRVCSSCDHVSYEEAPKRRCRTHPELRVVYIREGGRGEQKYVAWGARCTACGLIQPSR